MLANVGRGKEFCGISFYLALQGEEAIKAADATEDAGYRAGSHAQVDNLCCELVKLLQRDAAEVNPFVTQIVHQFLKVTYVGVECIAGVGTFQTQVLDVPHNDGARDGCARYLGCFRGITHLLECKMCTTSLIIANFFVTLAAQN